MTIAAAPPRPATGAVGSEREVSVGRPWGLLILGGLTLVMIAWLGLAQTCRWISIVLSVVFVVFLARHLAFAIVALQRAPADLTSHSSVDLGYRPRISVLVPCRNEELVVRSCVESLLALDYPLDRFECIVVDDRSTDRTGAILDELAAENPRLRVIHREAGAGGGKSGALNRAIEVASGEIVVVYDADHRPRNDALRRIVRHFADPSVAAVQGRCLVRNSAESGLARAVAVDYFSGYTVNEYGRQALFELPAYGGSNCAVRADVLRAVGGFDEATVTEDTDLTLRVVLAGFRLRFDVTSVDTEESVSSFRRFWRQRYRWARGHQQAWREYHRYVWRSRVLSPLQKLETTMFLLVYHVPVLCALGLLLLVLRGTGLVDWGRGLELTAFAALLFLGPLVELAGGLVVNRAPQRIIPVLLLFLPAFVIFAIGCAKAWVDGVLGRPYTWQKTPRSNAPIAVGART